MFTVLRARASAAPRAVSRASMARIASPVAPRLLPLSASRTFATSRATLFPEKKSTEADTKKSASTVKKTKAKAATTTKKTGEKAKPKPKKKVVAKKVKKVAPKKKKPAVAGIQTIKGRVVIPRTARPPSRPAQGKGIYYKEQYAAGKYGQPSRADLPAILSKAMQEWSALSETEKAVYNGKAAVLKDQYQEELRKWFAATPSAIRQEVQRRLVSKGHKPIRRPRNPLRPRLVTPYIQFFVEFKRQNPQLTFSECGTAAGAQWRSMSDSARAPYGEASKKENTARRAALPA
ncbi:hypothetical protein CYLTODRAFT_442669 [Cylindrobasidium torrendii FP15055 ss-10]|uniref:HMG box domain-containing protein n=1 Tax=Cylindrobasidium torrendii FP15055 ss-10 TaxID=1314674 RepID=A0A0D7BFW6_9AGAR|nr:hypothetical protein CYLTODRAFT_442669 [Cylindrobasidium torrendii FP15055 ss-10]